MIGEELFRMSLISWAPAVTGGADVMIVCLHGKGAMKRIDRDYDVEIDRDFRGD
jgi:hypothetical protein